MKSTYIFQDFKLLIYYINNIQHIKMNNGDQSKLCGKIFGDLRLYNEIDNTWIYVKPPTIGDVKYSIVEKDHAGWLICDGRSLSRTNYPELFELIGTKYGNVDANTFNLPDCRGRVLGAIGSGSGLTSRSAGTLIGAETHVLTTGEIPSHSHTSNAVGGTVGLITADGTNTAINVDSSSTEPNIYAAPAALTINNAGGGGAHNNMQPTAFLGNVFLFGKIIA